jgi:platelet-activating factor acetylhydrolase
MTRLNEADGGVKNLLDIHHAFSLSQFANIMDLSRPGICGHSFGGATTCMALATDERLKFGVALDAWLFPIRDEPIGKDLKQPIYFLSAGWYNLAKF